MAGKNQKAIYQKKLKEIVRALVKGYKPEKIILFGSLLTSKYPLSPPTDYPKQEAQKAVDLASEVLDFVEKKIKPPPARRLGVSF